MGLSAALCLALGPGNPPSWARQTLDRVVASMANHAITESDVEREYGFQLFLEGRIPTSSPDPATLERVRNQLIDQHLLLQEAAAEAAGAADLMTGAAERLAEVGKRFQSQDAYESALRAMGMDESQALQRLEQQEQTLRMIDQRLRPAAWVDPAEVETYYRETLAPEYAERSGTAAPALPEVEGQIREILVQKKIDQLLTTWLEELKSSREIRFHSF
jgi:hypothetical protein